MFSLHLEKFDPNCQFFIYLYMNTYVHIVCRLHYMTTRVTYDSGFFYIMRLFQSFYFNLYYLYCKNYNKT